MPNFTRITADMARALSDPLSVLAELTLLPPWRPSDEGGQDVCAGALCGCSMDCPGPDGLALASGRAALGGAATDQAIN